MGIDPAGSAATEVMMNLFIDIETLPSFCGDGLEAFRVHAEATQPETGEMDQIRAAEWRQAAVLAMEKAVKAESTDPLLCKVWSIAWAVDDGPVQCREVDEPGSTRGDREILDVLWDIPMNIIGWNVAWDVRVLRTLAARREGSLALACLQAKTVDVMRVSTHPEWRKYVSQDAMAASLGIQGNPAVDGMDGGSVWELWLNRDVKRLMAYNRNDVEVMREIYYRFGGERWSRDQRAYES